jgi:Ca2+-binding RTX toxin-like protein
VLSGGTGKDTIDSTVGYAEVYGGPGADTIDVDNGLGTSEYSDDVYAGSGDDTIKADDGKRDVIDCGEFDDPLLSSKDTDTVDADEFDELIDCELVS